MLLKNEGSVLPIRPGAKVLGRGTRRRQHRDAVGRLDGELAGQRRHQRGFRQEWPDRLRRDIRRGEARRTARRPCPPDGSFDTKPDVAIVVFGEKPYAEFQGDIPTLDYQPSEATDLALLRKLKAAGVPVVSVFLSGRPLFTSPEINASDAFVAAWLPGTQGDGIADVLVAGPGGKPRRDFTGRLPFAWPADARSPVVTPLFPVGYGLSYAQARARRHAQRRPDAWTSPRRSMCRTSSRAASRSARGR